MMILMAKPLEGIQRLLLRYHSRDAVYLKHLRLFNQDYPILAVTLAIAFSVAVYILVNLAYAKLCLVSDLPRMNLSRSFSFLFYP